MVFSREQESDENEDEHEDDDDDDDDNDDDDDDDDDEEDEDEDDLIDLDLDEDDNPYISSNSSNYTSLPLPARLPFLSISAPLLPFLPPTVLVPETPSPTSPKSPLFSFSMSETPSPHKNNTKFFF